MTRAGKGGKRMGGKHRRMHPEAWAGSMGGKNGREAWECGMWRKHTVSIGGCDTHDGREQCAGMLGLMGETHGIWSKYTI